MDEDMLRLLAEESDSRDAPPQADLENVKAYAKKLVDLENQIESLEDDILKLKRERENLRRFVLPTMLESLGVEAIVANNRECRLHQLVSATLPKDKSMREAAINWLVDNGHGGAVKRALSVDLPKGDAIAEELLKDAIRNTSPNLAVDVSYGVHHSTYTALAKQLVREGKVFPAELLGISVSSIVKVSED